MNRFYTSIIFIKKKVDKIGNEVKEGVSIPDLLTKGGKIIRRLWNVIERKKVNVRFRSNSQLTNYLPV